jgi:hypothetical protein
VIVGLDDPPGDWGVPVRYRHAPGPLAPFLPGRVIGQEVSSTNLRNGDFVISLGDARAGRIDRLARLTTDGERIPVTPAPEPARASTPTGDAAPTGDIWLGRRWLRPALITLAVVLITVLCGWFLIWGP